MKTVTSFAVVLLVVVGGVTAVAQTNKQMIMKRNDDATSSRDTKALNPQPIPPGKTGADSPRVLPPSPCKEARCKDQALNPQPIPPGKVHALNPQPIPPGHEPRTKKKKKKFD